jgi:hypothetical protein
MSGGQTPGRVLRGHAEFVRVFVREQAIQTNEVQRCWALLPCFLELARRTGAETLDVVELGPSAGLNLVWDRYRYRYANGEWGGESARLELHGEERRRVPAELLAVRPRVRSRVGIDVAPVDATTDDGARLLRSFVWPDQEWRLRQLDDAIVALRADPPELRRGDVVEVLPELLAARRADALTIVWQTLVLEYLPRERRVRVHEALERAGESGGLAFVQASIPRDDRTYQLLEAQLWPGGVREVLAHADFHGAWLDWRAP